jgi:type I restriction enzyme S subunit
MSEVRPATRRFQRYPKYKPTGVEWLSEVPVSWEIRRIGAVCEAVSGGTPSKEEASYWNGDVPWFRQRT